MDTEDTSPEFSWDRAVAHWIDGGSSIPDELAAWSRAYTGGGDAAPVFEALPEPYFGDTIAPKAVFLALNPGQAFFGKERWHQRELLPDLQSRNGLFAAEIRATGSYSQWASRFPDWARWVQGGNGFYLDRFRFAGYWNGDRSFSGDDCLLLELWPWHSRSFNTGAFRPGREALAQISKHVLARLEALPSAPVFAFGAPWFDVLPRLHFDEVKRWSVASGHHLGAVKDRAISIFDSGKVKIVAEKHKGGASPPKQVDVAVIRELLEPFLD